VYALGDYPLVTLSIIGKIPIFAQTGNTDTGPLHQGKPWQGFAASAMWLFINLNIYLVNLSRDETNSKYSSLVGIVGTAFGLWGR
jgi:hypothetical protein